MALYRYTARDSHGTLIEGEMEAPTVDEVANRLAQDGATPITIEGTELTPRTSALVSRLFGEQRLELDDIILFCQQMYTLTRTGVPLMRGVAGLAESTRNRFFREVLERLTNDISIGHSLSTAMGNFPKVFNPFVISMVNIGENTGRLDEAFRQLARYLEMEKETRARIRSALRYPVMVLVAIAIAMVVINYFVIPAFSAVFAGINVELPWPTRVLITVSAFFVEQWYLLPALIIGIVAAVRYYLATATGRLGWDRIKLRLPLVGNIILRSTLARFARTFAMSVRSGVPLIQTLVIVSHVADNEYVASRILSMREGIENGDSLTRTAAATGLFTPLVLQMLSVGEESGALEEMLDEAADFYDRDVDYDLRNLSAAIEPLLIVAVGLLVLVLALGVFLPMWDLTVLTRH